MIMAKDKNSFLIYCDIIHTVEKLTDEQSGKLFKHLLKYVNDLDPIPEDIVTEIAFEPIKQSLKRDLLKYEKTSAKNAENGRKGAEKRWNKNNELSQPMATIANASQPMAKMADSDSDSDSELLSKDNNKNGGWEKVIGLFPPTKQNGLVEAAIVWNSLEQKQKQSVMRHLNPYIKNTEERFMKQIGNYFKERLWENMKPKTSTNKIKMLDYNFIEWFKNEYQIDRFDDARTDLASLQLHDIESFNDIENEYKQTKN